MIISHEKTCAGFGSITQVMALHPVCGELMTQAQRHASMTSELPERFNSARFISGHSGHQQTAIACERIHEPGSAACR
jgi:hypothetical protein